MIRLQRKTRENDYQVASRILKFGAKDFDRMMHVCGRRSCNMSHVYCRVRVHCATAVSTSGGRVCRGMLT